MSDETQGQDTSESSRRKVSQRSYLDSQGADCDRIEEATGARYTLLDPNGNHNFDEQFGAAGNWATMNAIFGFHTKIGNVANTVLNNKEEPGTPADAANAIKEFIAAAKDSKEPTWAERSTGVGVRIDKEALAGAIVAVATAAGKAADYAAIRQRLEEEPAYVRKARQVPAVASEYASRVGKVAVTVEDLLS